MGLFSRILGTQTARTNQADKPSPKIGLLQGTATGGGLLNRGDQYKWVAEVEEIDRIGRLSKLKFLKVTGADQDMLLKIMPEWFPTNDIIWKEPTQSNKERVL